MPQQTFVGSVSSPKVDVFIDTGNPLINHTVDGFLKIGTVHVHLNSPKSVHCLVFCVTAEETFHVVHRGFLFPDLISLPVLLSHS
ncbi:hypothetical protein LXL04_021468 [Taraxacum kok-saghyz]